MAPEVTTDITAATARASSAETAATGDVTYLHIGAMKTGTSFIQNVLWGNREQLRSDGVLFPGERAWGEQVEAARHVVALPNLKGDPVPPGPWHRLTRAIRDWTGTSVIVSMEFLSLAGPRQARRILSDLSGRDTHVVITARDLARITPAQWQESTQNRATWTWPDYLASVMSHSEEPPGRRFWRQHDLLRIVRTWADVVPASHLHLVTVPPPGAPRDLLWRRFCSVVGLEAERYDVASYAQNESIGVVSAELMRAVNAYAEGRLDPMAYDRQLKWYVSKTLLPERTGEPRAGIPPEHQAFFVEHSRRLVADLATIDMEVVGDLDDLLSRPVEADVTTADAVTDAEKLDAAVEMIVALAAHADSLHLRLNRQRKLNAAAPNPVETQSVPATEAEGRFAAREAR